MNNFAMYSPLRAWKKGDIPADPFVSLELGTHVESDGRQILTPNLMTDAEIDYEVDCLIKELEQFRKAAKKELLSLRAKMHGN
ncbi:MAG: hypothetical protein H6R10_2710 [Rhodocyclaceae bacterium]|nr:hypothetical protein [Rhodocyclaceae bacterium]